MLIQKKAAVKQGFTLIELLVVIAVVAILATVVFVALNPVIRFQDARNSKRWSDVNALLDAAKLSQVDIKNHIAEIEGMTAGVYYQIGTAREDPNCAVSCLNPTRVLEGTCIDLTELVDRAYIPAIPIDPSGSGAAQEYAHYYIYKNNTGVITVGACDEELGSNETVPDISVTR